MRQFLIAAALAGAGLAVASCATMNEAQCLAGDWSGQGYADGAAGRGEGRLEDHRKACERHGVYADDRAYYAGHQQGVRTYCRPARGFAVGRSGGGYANGFCPADLEQDFLYGLADGRLVWDAQSRVNDIVNAINADRNRAEAIEDEIRDLEHRLAQAGVTQEQRDTWRARIRRLGGERDDALLDARNRERDLERARRDLSRVRSQMMPIYGDW